MTRILGASAGKRWWRGGPLHRGVFNLGFGDALGGRRRKRQHRAVIRRGRGRQRDSLSDSHLTIGLAECLAEKGNHLVAAVVAAHPHQAEVARAEQVELGADSIHVEGVEESFS